MNADLLKAWKALKALERSHANTYNISRGVDSNKAMEALYEIAKLRKSKISLLDSLNKKADFFNKIVSFEKNARWWDKAYKITRTPGSGTRETLSFISKKPGLEHAPIATLTTDSYDDNLTRFVEIVNSAKPGKGFGGELYNRALGEAKQNGVTGFYSDPKGSTSLAASRIWENQISKKYNVEKHPTVPKDANKYRPAMHPDYGVIFKKAGLQAELYKDLKPQVLKLLNLRTVKETKGSVLQSNLNVDDYIKFHSTSHEDAVKALNQDPIHNLLEANKHPLQEYLEKFDGPIPTKGDKHFSRDFLGSQQNIKKQLNKKAGVIKYIKKLKTKKLLQEHPDLIHRLSQAAESEAAGIKTPGVRTIHGVFDKDFDFDALDNLDKKANFKQDVITDIKNENKDSLFADVKEYVRSNYDYGKYLFKHKYYVGKAGLQLDLPVMQLAVHDYNKLTPKRWSLYRQWMSSDQGRHGTRDPKLYKKFRDSADKHLASESHGHHWYRMGTPIEKVPVEYRLESLADWYSVYRSQNDVKNPQTFRTWYKERRKNLPLDPVAKQIADQKLIYNV